MKHLLKHIIIAFLWVGNGSLLAQEFSVGVNVDNPNPNAVLHLSSPNGNQGLLMPRLTTDQRNNMNLTANDNGLMVFDETESTYYFWDGTAWATISNDATPWEDDRGDLFYDNGNVGIGTATPESLLQLGGSFALSSFSNTSGSNNPISGNFIGTNLGVDYTDPINNQLIRLSGDPGSMVFMQQDSKITFLKVEPGTPGSIINIGDGGDVKSTLELDETGNAEFRFGVRFGQPDAGTEQDGMIRFDDGGTNRLQLFNAGAWENIATEGPTTPGSAANLTLVNPNPTLLGGDPIGGIFIEGTRPNGTPELAGFIEIFAAENWTNTFNGSSLSLGAIPLNGNIPIDIMKVEHNGAEGFVRVDGTVELTGKLVSIPNTTILPISAAAQVLPPPIQRVHLLSGTIPTASVESIDDVDAIPGQELILICQANGGPDAFIVQHALTTGNIQLDGGVNFNMDPGDTLHLIYIEDPLGTGVSYWMEIGRADN
ncbi:MAG: hypothetical protein AAF551_13705 [Bacteroidota bacterium]